MNNRTNFDNVYELATHNIRVAVRPHYDEERSSPETYRYYWAYEVEITNESGTTVQLLDRSWQIIDANGEEELVRGPGVVGEQPILNPGDRFQYTSGCPLKTPSGFMAGSYTMTNGEGDDFIVDIPAFSLDLPFGRSMVN